MTDLGGRRAIVTGASSGLGRHFAGVLAAAGAEVTLAARRLEALEAAAVGLPGAQAVALDVTDAGSVAAAFAGMPYDIVINNAGVAHDAPALETGEADWGRVIDTDLSGVFRVARAAAGAMVAAGQGGSIVNLASITAHRVAGRLAAYATAKAGVLQMTKALALEWARHGIRVNALSPGYVETEINRHFFATEAGQGMVRRIPMRRLGRLQDLDGALLLLASDAGAYITGTDIVVDGGHLVSSL